MRRPLRTHLLVWMLACWQALLLVVCVPSASARPTPALAAHACCESSRPTMPTTDVACPHCSDGHGRFVDAMQSPPMVAPVALVDRVTLDPAEAEPVATLADERPIYRPPDPSLFALRCALIR